MKKAESYGRKKREALPLIFDFGDSELSLLETAVSPMEEVKLILSKMYTKSSIV